MTRIEPVHFGQTGPLVSNLHEGLLVLIRKQPGISDKEVESLEKQLKDDRDHNKFGQATLNLVKILQEQLKSRPDVPKKEKEKWQDRLVKPPNGDVDQETVDGLSWLLTK